MHFAISYIPASRFPTVDELIGPAPSAAEVATRAAVDIALINARMAKLSTYHDACPGWGFSGWRRGTACTTRGYHEHANRVYDRAQPYPDERPPGPIEYLTRPGAYIVH